MLKTRSPGNTALRLFVGLNKFSWISKIFQILKIFNIEDRLHFSKLNFIRSTQFNPVYKKILTYIPDYSHSPFSKSLSIYKGLLSLKTKFNLSNFDLLNSSNVYKKALKNQFLPTDGL